MSKKRTLDSFFGPAVKKQRLFGFLDEPQFFSRHAAYPFPIPALPPAIGKELTSLPARPGRAIRDQPHLDLLYFEPFIPSYMAKDLFHFLRAELPFYRVEYQIKRYGVETHMRTPRFTTVFGLDETSRFDPTGAIVEAKTGMPVSSSSSPSLSPPFSSATVTALTTVAVTSPTPPPTKPASPMPKPPSSSPSPYARYAPRPIPACLDELRQAAERATGCAFNFCLVNYYASGADSISFHSDDERFLGPLPAIASFSLGARRDFVMKHKPVVAQPGGGKAPAIAGGGGDGDSDGDGVGHVANTPPGRLAAAAAPSAAAARPPQFRQLKLPLASGDMVLMRGETQANWLHSIPKRTGRNEKDGGRINITFRRAMVKGGTDNYYNYNVGTGPVFKWDHGAGEMRLWKNDHTEAASSSSRPERTTDEEGTAP